jgi:hypothetical protein
VHFIDIAANGAAQNWENYKRKHVNKQRAMNGAL